MSPEAIALQLVIDDIEYFINSADSRYEEGYQDALAFVIRNLRKHQDQYEKKANKHR